MTTTTSTPTTLATKEDKFAWLLLLCAVGFLLPQRFTKKDT